MKYENLLKPIANGNPVTILKEPDLIAKFDMLLKQNLIEVTRDKVVMTQKGRELLNFSAAPTLLSPVTEQEIKEFGEKARSKGKTFYVLSLFLLMISIFFVFAVNFYFI